VWLYELVILGLSVGDLHWTIGRSVTYTDHAPSCRRVHAAGPPAGAAAGPTSTIQSLRAAKAPPKQWDPRVIVGPSRDQLSNPNSFHRS
jgi:hypothetical protein